MITMKSAIQEFAQQKEVYADAFSIGVFNGRVHIDPTSLQEVDITEFTEVMGQDYQDLLNKVIVMKNNSAYMALISLDGQSPVDYSLPVRILNLETWAYAICFDKGIRKPIITLVINWRMEPWDGPVDLYSMMRDDDPDIRAVSRNYKLNLLDPMTIPDDGICRFQSELMPVLVSMKYSRNKSDLEAFTEKHSERFQHLSQFAVNIITQATDGTSGCQIC